jgi:hypothetical protein
MCSNAPDDESLKWLQKNRLEQLGLNFRTVWTIYIAFYAAFHTLSVAALGWFLATKAGAAGMPTISTDASKRLAYVFIYITFLTLCTSTSIAIYSRAVGHQYSTLELEVSPSASKGRSVIPTALAIWGACANATAMIGIIFAWWYVGIHMPGKQ